MLLGMSGRRVVHCGGASQGRKWGSIPSGESRSRLAWNTKEVGESIARCGYLLYARQGVLVAQQFDLEALTTTAAPTCCTVEL